MRFKKGSKVEVRSKEAPASWCVAEIISGNGHAYNVRYNGYQGVEKVSRGNIRPYPPAIGSQSWVTGDIVEVFDENSWKVATVLKVLKGGRYLVRLHEFAREIRVHKTSIRARKAWCDGQWIQVGKISGTNEVEPSFSMKICQKEDDCLPVYNDARLRKRKRASPFCSSLLKAKKVKPAEKDGNQSQSQRHSFEKVDAFEGNKYMQASFNYSLNGYYEMEKKKRKTYGVAGCSLARISEPNESDSDRCSVGSCSVPSDGYNKLSSHYDADILSSDGESSNTSWVEHEVTVSVHRATIGGMHLLLPKGPNKILVLLPFSWKKQWDISAYPFATDKTVYCDKKPQKSTKQSNAAYNDILSGLGPFIQVLGIKVECMNKEGLHPGVLMDSS
ncbi:hypothetical protein L1987_10020 [Smallanthus sonchifolius]|uniref:Uncharacterized protein n=1 Tax=Smallanthus sonchifolius TaxID=185202 RepID=A0ACB9JR32_9ASTR|nr:hypothetical protein L1987_10020 [Smallanthus sonchifolius]